MKKRFYSSVVIWLICLGLTLPVNVSWAAEQQVAVTLPRFAVQLDGNAVDNDYREYPLLVYKDITYFPMTWNDSRLLRLATEWDPTDGLKIVQSKVPAAYHPDLTTAKNSSSYEAAILNFPITVNGKTIDNASEEYPFLSFRDITYFPLTWKFAHDEFGWDYTWDSSAGLSINSKQPHVKTVNLPAYARDNGVAFYKGYYYFVETVGSTNKIYRLAEGKADQELVYSYEVSTNYGFNNLLTFVLRQDQLWFSYHLGGALMGSDVYCRINDNGTATQEQRGYLDFKETPQGVLQIRQFVPPGGNNLWLIPPGKEEKDGRSVGDPTMIYGWRLATVESGRGFSPNTSTTVVGDSIYVLASSYPEDNGNRNRIYCISLTTNETTKVINAGVQDFQVIHDKLYYVKEDEHYLYTAKLDGAGEQKLSDRLVAAKYGSWYGEINDSVYYTTAADDGYYYLYQVDPAKDDRLVIQEPVDGVEIVNSRIICRLASGANYGLKILDQEGNLSLVIAEQVSDLFVSGNGLLLKLAVDQSIQMVRME